MTISQGDEYALERLRSSLLRMALRTEPGEDLGGRMARAMVAAGIAGDSVKEGALARDMRLMLAHQRRIDELARQVDELQRLVQVDALSGLYTRRHFLERLRGEINRASRCGQALAVIMADIDRFKQVNDRHGHLAGDAVLARFGAVVRQCLRNYDFAGRLGGEEFAIALPQAGPRQARTVAERLRRKLASQQGEDERGETIAVTASFGVAAFDGREREPSSLIARADKALYAAKRAGRDRVCTAA